MNPEKPANAVGRCWKDILGRNRSFKTHRPPYLKRIGHRLARDQETLTGRNLDGQCQRGPEGANPRKLPVLVTRTKQKEVWRSLVRAS